MNSRRRHCALLAGLVIGLAGQVVSQAPAPRPVYQAARASGPIVVDGRLDDPAWRSAAVIDSLYQVEPAQGALSSFGTSVQVLFDDTRLIFGIFNRDSLGAAGIRVRDLRRKFDYFANDLFGISLDPLHDGRNAIAFQVTPYGTQRDLQVVDGSLYNREWEGVWTVRTSISDSGWSAEIAIPWSTLSYRTDGIPWGMNFYRIARRANETSAWVAWPRNLNAYRMDYAGQLAGLDPPRSRARIRFRPYLLGATTKAIGTEGGAGDHDGIQVGGEMSWAPGSSARIDLTANTDFAQADVDRQVVNLSRFSVFFPEKRGFFLENASLFETGFADEYVIQPFFSRRIGLAADGSPLAIQAGARVIRQTSSSALGGLLIKQDGSSNEGAATFGVARASRNIGAASRIGGLVTGRFDEAGVTSGARESGVVAVDGFTRIGSTSISGMVSHSMSTDAGGEGVGAHIYAMRQTDRLYTGFVGAVATDGYAPTTGFVSRNDVLLASPAVIGDLRPKWRPSWIRGFKPALISWLYFGARDQVLQEGYVQSYIDIVGTRGEVAYPYVERHFQRPTRAFELLDGITIPAGENDFWRYGGRLVSDPSAPMSFLVDASTGGFYNGRLVTLIAQGRVALSPRLSFELGYEGNRLRRIGIEGRDVTTHLVAPEIRFSPTARVHLTAFYQYNSESDRGTLNGRLSWEFAPLSYLYVVYNDQRVTGESLTAPPRASRRQLIVKAVYLHQL